MTFVDPDTNMVINCTPWEYEQLKPKFIKTEWTTYTKEVKVEGGIDGNLD